MGPSRKTSRISQRQPQPSGDRPRKGNPLADPEVVARKTATATLPFKAGAKRGSLIEWNQSRQTQILDWHHRAKDYGLAVEEREDVEEGQPYAVEPRQLLEEEEPEAFSDQPIRRRADYEALAAEAADLTDDDAEEQPLEAGATREDVDLVRVYLQHIGKRKLLKAHQEVEIGERIERAQKDLLAAMADIPGAVQTLVALADRIRLKGVPAIG